MNVMRREGRKKKHGRCLYDLTFSPGHAYSSFNCYNEDLRNRLLKERREGEEGLENKEKDKTQSRAVKE